MNAPWAVGMHLDFPKLRASNAILGDRTALNAAFERDGYWYFENILDADAVAALRQVYVDELVGLGVIDADDPTYAYNGAPLDQLPNNPVSGVLEGMFRRAPWREFVSVPAIHDQIRAILGDDPAWMPILGYRVAKPKADPLAERLEFVHQDGFFNPGIPFLNCWIPLVEIDEAVGGIAVAEGYHRFPKLHEKGEPPKYLMPRAAIPRSAWRRADFKPGDLLVLHLDTPHSGITNVSADRFRMSLDLRMLPASGPVPIIGEIENISAEAITLVNDQGERRILAIGDYTYCRGKEFVSGARIEAATLLNHYGPGDSVIVSHTDGKATVVRPAAY
jgi:hypothetical protein